MSKKSFITLSLNSESDKDILRWIERQDNKSAAIRAAIREHIEGGGVTLGDVYQAIKDIERKLRAGVIVAGGDVAQAGAGYEEHADLAAALDALAKQ